jgi:hypothetical protein
MAVAKEALQRYQRLCPHGLPSLADVARLCVIASDFGRLASGLDSTQPVPPPSRTWEDVEAGLRRAYGGRSGDASNGALSPAQAT